MVVTGEGLGLVVVLGLEVEGQSGQRWLPQADPVIHHLLRPPSPGPAHADWGASPDPRLAWPRGSDFAALDRADWRYRGNRCSRRDPSAFCPQTSAERNREEKGLLYCWREGRGKGRGAGGWLVGRLILRGTAIPPPSQQMPTPPQPTHLPTFCSAMHCCSMAHAPPCGESREMQPWLRPVSLVYATSEIHQPTNQKWALRTGTSEPKAKHSERQRERA